MQENFLQVSKEASWSQMSVKSFRAVHQKKKKCLAQKMWLGDRTLAAACGPWSLDQLQTTEFSRKQSRYICLTEAAAPSDF